MYITITGLDHYMGTEALRPGDKLYLIKDTKNAYDDEAIKVIGDNDTTYGYVANSVDTVARGTHSAGYIYNSINDNQKCKVAFILDERVIAELV